MALKYKEKKNLFSVKKRNIYWTKVKKEPNRYT